MHDLNALSKEELTNLTLNLLELLEMDNGNLLNGEDLRQYTLLVACLIKQSQRK